MDIDLLINNFKKNRIKVTLLENGGQLISFLKDTIPNNSIVGVGDSVTLEETGVYDFLRGSTYVFLDKYDKGLSSEEKREIYLRNFAADFFISGLNAVSMDGKIINMEGNGSRVAPMIYGPKKVLLITGTNKIVENEEQAMARIKNIAAPLDNIRLSKKNPCVKIGKCSDCKSKSRICNYYSVIQGQFDENRIELILLNGTYGY